MRQALRYAGLSVALGVVTFWASENFFWSALRPDMGLADLGMTWVAYVLCSACALSAVILTRCDGWTGLFLGGAILGWLVEGVVVGAMYESFPFQIVWTPLAWHALVSCAGVLGLSLATAGGRLRTQVLAMVALGVFGAVWSAYWPMERDDLPASGGVFAYLAGVGVPVAMALAVIGRTGALPRPGRAVLLVTPVLAVLVWAAGTVADPSLVRLSCPLMIGVTVWMMARLGRREGEPLVTARPVPVWRHGLFLIVPVITASGLLLLWREPGLPVNQIIALLTGPLSLGAWLWLLWRAYTARAARASRRSRAPS